MFDNHKTVIQDWGYSSHQYLYKRCIVSARGGSVGADCICPRVAKATPTKASLLWKHSLTLLALLVLCTNSTAFAQGQSVKPVSGLTALKGMEKLTGAPADFPVPTYSEKVISTDFVRATNSKGSTVTSITKTQNEPRLPFQWYQKLLSSSGWSILLPNEKTANPAQKNGKLLMLQAMKDKLRLFIVCFQTEKVPYTTINVSFRQN